MSKILNNLPVEDLNEENDYLGIIDKGQIIKTFLESNTEEFTEIKMFSLYGEWGSGKSTLMKYLEKELKGSFNTYFFEAWQYESDDNLSLSLLEYLSYKSSDSTEEALGEIVEVAAKLFRGFSKSMRITVPGLSIDGSKIVESLEEEPKETFYQLKKKFQEEFGKWESHVTRGKNPKFNIVFIDDLDRCEPENVLNLLSALKLFFTYGEKTIFFCGVDKKAVNEAVKTKYGNVVKANEYLEKVFDISFTMPEHDDLLKLVSQYFDDRKLKEVDGRLNVNIAKFFRELRFTNPRKVKKVLNKYLTIKNLKEQDTLQEKQSRLIPCILTSNGGNYLETVITLYLIVIHEFYPEILDDMFNLDLKMKVFEKAIEESAKINSSNKSQVYIANTVNDGLDFFSRIYELIVVERISLSEILSTRFYLNESDKRRGLNPISEFAYINTLFCPSDIQKMNARSIITIGTFKKGLRVEEVTVSYYFIKYLLQDNIKFNELSDVSNIPLIEMKKTIKTLF
ncbi:P-loop NTPase fold protein [Seonamhaeicola sp.]|uniref:KAP family P-loop NTPase fold protein n=1 Tax=Seonamhaeicola sp. TaxID=1912245 RepID=UPI00261EBDD6|nr:P-loop NTPase fold protein [Seonamhaeicola sp.]